MGVGLTYRTTSPVSAAVAEAVRGDVPGVNRGARWIYCEPVGVRHDEADGYLTGFSKLNLQPGPDEYAAAKAEPADRDDFLALLDALAGWSARYDLTWELAVEGQPLGRVAGGAYEPGLRDALESFAAVADELVRYDPFTGELYDEAGREDEGPSRPRLYRPDGE